MYFFIQKNFISILLLTLNFSLISNANSNRISDDIRRQVQDIQQQNNINVIDSFCIGDPEDPYDVGPIMKDGPHSGQCLDIEKNRALFINKPSGLESFSISNVRFGGHWWTATNFDRFSSQFPVIDKVYYVLVEFPKSIPWLRDGHVELRFKFKKGYGVKLKPQVINDNVEFNEGLEDVIFSINAFGIYGRGFNAFEGMKKNFGIIGNMVSTYDRVIEEVVYSKATLSQIELNLTEQQKYDLLTNAIKTSAFKLKYDSIYHTLFYNCVTTTMNLIDETIPRPSDVPSFIDEYSRWTRGWFFNNPWIGILPHWKDIFFEPSVNALYARNLVKQWGPTLNEEFQGGELAFQKIGKYLNSQRKPNHPLK